MDEKEIKIRFTYHTPKGGQTGKYEVLRRVGRELAQTIDNLCPESREKSLAITKLEECVMWANSSVARRE